MLPCMPKAQMRKVGDFHGKSCGQFFQAHTLMAQLSNLPNLIIGQFVKMCLFALMSRWAHEHTKRVQLILTWRDVFQVFKTIIRRVAVNVVRYQTYRFWAYESVHNQHVNLPSLSRVMKRDSLIPEPMIFGQQHPVASDATHSAHIAHFVKGAMLNNRQPLFFHRYIVTEVA